MISKLLLFALLLLVPSHALAGDDDEVQCRSCDSTGMRVCKEHKKAECKLEDGLVYCNEFEGCELCAGTGFVDCTKCENEVASEELARRAAERVRNAEQHKWIHEKMERRVRLLETEHFRLVWELDSLKVNKKRLNGHQLAHLYGSRLERLWEDYANLFGATERSFKEKPLILVWWLPKDQVKSSSAFCNTGSRQGAKLLGSTPRFSLCGNKQFARDDDTLHRSIVHNVTHLLLSHQSPAFWIGNVKGGWADAGLAHWFEEKYWGVCTNYCYQEQNTQVGFKGGKYKVAVRKLVAEEKTTAAAVVFQKNTDTLTPLEHALSFSYVDYLLSIDGSKFSNLVRLLKKREPTRDALKEIYGMNPLEFESGWKAWVLETYPKR